MKKLSGVIIGYGVRGEMYGKYAEENPNQVEIVAVAEPSDNKREDAKKRFNLGDDCVFNDWKKMIEKKRIADFAIIATQDNMHVEPALACIEMGYDLLLEKPIAPTPQECKTIYEAAKKKGVKVIVCHVLRFTRFYRKIKDIIDEGTLGKIISIEASEGVGNIHQSHSYVRGNWRNEKESSCMILAKCCHDMDIIQWILGKQCKKIQSFGSLTYFTKENQPKGATDRCLDGCPYYDTCFYSVKKVYIDDKDNGWLRGVVTGKPISHPKEISDEAVVVALKNGPYGRCVYCCDNDVVDHQVVNMEFEDKSTVAFSMNAFNKGGRKIRIFGTKGEICADNETGIIEIFKFEDRSTLRISSNAGNEITSGHGGGDTGIMESLVNYFGNNMPDKSVSSFKTSYINHIMAFAADSSMKTGKVIDIDEYLKGISELNH